MQDYASDSEVDAIVRNENYGIDYPYFCFGLSFENSGTAYKYNLRFNVTNQGSEAPNPNTDLTTRAKINLGIYRTTLYSGLQGLTNVVNNVILQTETSNSHMLVNKQGPIYQ